MTNVLSKMSGNRSHRYAFTLVELLVVIGIIALLISILLPSLNRARESARSIKCSANLHSLGQGLQIYLQDSKGMLPFGWTDGFFNPNGPDFAVQKPYSNWGLLLLHSLNGKFGADTTEVSNNNAGSSKSSMLQMLQCPTVASASSTKDYGIVNHYAAHPRLFPAFNSSPSQSIDPATGKKWNTMKASRVKRSSEILTIFDGSLVPVEGGAWDANNTICVANSIDNFRLYNYSSNTTFLTENYTTAAGIKNTDPIEVGLYQKPDTDFNADTPGNGNNVRFRHGGNNTVMNGLMFDGHVEGFRVNNKSKVTDLLRKNINVTY